MDQILTIRLYAAGIGIVVGEFLGSFDDLLYALVVFVATDYVTGVLRAIVEKKLSSAIGFKGICKKVWRCKRPRYPHHRERLRPTLCRNLLLHLE